MRHPVRVVLLLFVPIRTALWGSQSWLSRWRMKTALSVGQALPPADLTRHHRLAGGSACPTRPPQPIRGGFSTVPPAFSRRFAVAP